MARTFFIWYFSHLKEARAGNCHTSYHNMIIPFKETWYTNKNIFESLSNSLISPAALVININPCSVNHHKPLHNAWNGVSLFFWLNNVIVYWLNEELLSLFVPSRENDARVSCRGTAQEMVRTLTAGLLTAYQHKGVKLGAGIEGQFLWPLDHFDHTLQIKCSKHACLRKLSVPAECLVLAHEVVLSPCVTEEM